MTRRAPEFFSAPPLLAVAVLGANDHFLKDLLHNGLTGKLSDFAGCFFLPLYVSAVLRFITRWSLGWRLTIGAVTTLAVFVPVNLSRVAADFVCRAVEVLSVPLGIGALRIASDPTDLIALPMIGLAVWYARKVNPCVASLN